MAHRFYRDYRHLGLSLDDIRAVMEAHPNLGETRLRKLLDRYLDVISNNPNLVKNYGALAVFQEFVVLAAYDPAHGGNYLNGIPSVERQLNKGMEEATAELGVMEMGKVSWPITPSNDPKYEGTDPSGQKWDVKGPLSRKPNGDLFNADSEVENMQKDFVLGENIILDDRNMMLTQIQKLYEQLKVKGQDGQVVWWPIDPTP